MLEKLDFDQLLGNYSAVTDCPGWMFWEELVDFYPEVSLVFSNAFYGVHLQEKRKRDHNHISGAQVGRKNRWFGVSTTSVHKNLRI